jgi:hypothetical protein
MSLDSVVGQNELVENSFFRFAIQKQIAQIVPRYWVREEFFGDLVESRITTRTRLVSGYFQRIEQVDEAADELLNRLSRKTEFWTKVTTPEEKVPWVNGS